MPYDWVDPEIYMIHNGVVVYHVYKYDAIQDGAREFWFCLAACESRDDGEHTFDVMSLPRPAAGSNEEAEMSKKYAGLVADPVIAWNIDNDYFDDYWEKDEPPAPCPAITEALPTMLASLRYFVANTEESERRELYPSFFDRHPPLTDEKIDQLCQVLNTGEVTIVR